MSTVRKLRGDEVAARDGSVGSVNDVYFDDQNWAVRYLVVHTERWPPPRRMLIPPESVEPGLSGPRKIRLGLTRAQVDRVRPRVAAPGRLHSGTDLIGYGIEARDGPLGEVQDFIVDDDTWAIRDVVVDTRKWWPGGHVRVHPAYVERIDRQGRKMHLRLTRAQVRRSGARSARR